MKALWVLFLLTFFVGCAPTMGDRIDYIGDVCSFSETVSKDPEMSRKSIEMNGIMFQERNKEELQ